MSDWQIVLSQWRWDSPAVLLAGIAAVACLVLLRGSLGWRLVPFTVGLVAFVLAFASPIGTLADGYLFGAHMLQHLLLLLIVPACFWLSLPEGRVRAWRPRWEPSRSLVSRLPLLGWAAGLGAMWLWHVPTLCVAALANQPLGVLRDATFLLAGLAFWWPIYAPLPEARLEPPRGVVYLFSACVGCTLLGVYLTFTSVAVCPVFAAPPSGPVAAALAGLGWTPAADQRLGGLLMWVPPCVVYVCAILGLLKRWYSPREIATVTPQLGGRHP